MDKIQSAPIRKNIWITEIPKKLIQDSKTSYSYSNKKNYFTKHS